MTAMCGRCHGNFHGDPGVGSTGSSPWIRHPSDVKLTDYGGEYATYLTYSWLTGDKQTTADNAATTNDIANRNVKRPGMK